MERMNSHAAYQAAIDLIEEQLRTLPVSLAMIVHPPAAREDPSMQRSLAQLQNKRRTHTTGSVGNIVAGNAPHDSILDLAAANHFLRSSPVQRNAYLRVVIGNALLAVGMFLKEHDMAAMRTPEIQFLDHVCNAILNANRFTLEPDYMPIATFDGLVIDSSLDGNLLFGDGVRAGFMEFGDAIALLRWLVRYLRGENHFVTGGDAG